MQPRCGMDEPFAIALLDHQRANEPPFAVVKQHLDIHKRHVVEIEGGVAEGRRAVQPQGAHSVHLADRLWSNWGRLLPSRLLLYALNCSLKKLLIVGARPSATKRTKARIGKERHIAFDERPGQIAGGALGRVVAAGKTVGCDLELRLVGLVGGNAANRN